MRNMNERPICHRAEDLVTYLYGEASEAEAKDFANHVQSCDACRAEFAVFQQVHDSILEWRSEALGAISFAHDSTAAAMQANTALTATSVGSKKRLSAIAAVREFFNVSPLWLRCAAALASILFCVLVVLAAARLWQKPSQVVRNGNDDRVYTPEQFKQEVAKQVDEKVAAIKKSQAPTPTTSMANNNPAERKPARQRSLTGSQLATLPQTRLTRKEREQLAADLRLVPGPDDDDLPFVLPNEPNQ
jgi:hypothetical protein